MKIDRKEILDSYDIDNIINRYKKRFDINGYSPLSLGWGKGKQNLRFKMLTTNFQLNNKSILDIGCGFGDINRWLKQNEVTNYNYLGIDVVEEFVSEAKNRYSDYNVKFEQAEFLSKQFNGRFDYIIESGIFNHIMEHIDNYDYIFKVMEKAFMLCDSAISFDFLSSKVDFQRDGAFHSEPSVILEMAYSLSSRVILNNSYMPYEFNVIVFKDEEVFYDHMCYMTYRNIV